jgi:hypothetical protein
MGASYKDKNSEISYKYCLNLEYLEIKYCDWRRVGLPTEFVYFILNSNFW